MIYMDVTCNVIEDLLPLYADGICSEDTKTIIEHHIAVCPECREKLEAMTAKLETSEKKAKIDNPFKKVRNHYIRLVTVTLLVCALIIVPLGSVWYLSTNTYYSNGYTWSSLKMEMKINSLCKLIKKGKYREFLEEVILPNQYSYSYPEVSKLKDLMAEDFENYFKKYPIERVVVNVDEGDCDSGNAAFVIKTDITDCSVIQLISFNYSIDYKMIEIWWEGSATGVFSGDEFEWVGEHESNYGFGSLEKQCEINSGFPQLELISRNLISGIFGSIDYDDKAISVGWIAGLRSDYEQRFTRERRDEVKIIEEKLEEIRDKYRCSSELGGSVEYIRETVSLGGGVTKDRYYMQPVFLTMKDLSGEKFQVSFDMPIAIDGYPVYLLDLRNITYSENTPEEFKTMFEDIFA